MSTDSQQCPPLCQRGNAIIEMVLFVPLALFFLFVVTDAGLSLLQKAAIEDDFRAAVHSSAAHAKTISAKEIRDLDDSQLEEISSLVSRELFNSISASLDIVAGESDLNFGVLVSVYELDIDSSSGGLVSSKARYIGGEELESGSLQKVAARVPNTEFVSEEQYVSSFLSSESSREISRFAHPSGSVHSLFASGDSASESNYQPTSILIYLEVRAIPKGINAAYVGQAMGRFFSMQRQSLRALRLQ